MHRNDPIFAWTMGGLAFLGLLAFLVLPFIMAVILSFTNQHLISPLPTENVGLRNFDRLLSVSVLTLDPLVDSQTGQVQKNSNGEIQYPSSRTIISDTQKYPQYQDFSEWFHFDLFGKRYVVLGKNPVFLQSLVNNFLFAAIVVPLQSSLALLLALLINQKIRGINIFRAIYFSPVVTSMVVVSVIWTFLYNQRVGLVNEFLTGFTAGMVGPFNWLGSPQSALVAIVIMSVWQGVGFQMVIFLAGLQGISDILYEAAKIDGANRWQQFWYVTIPQLHNTIIFVVISTTILAFRLFTQVDIMTHGGPLNATSTVVYDMVTSGFRENQIGFASAMSVIFFIIVLIIALIQQRVLRERRQVEV